MCRELRRDAEKVIANNERSSRETRVWRQRCENSGRRRQACDAGRGGGVRKVKEGAPKVGLQFRAGKEGYSGCQFWLRAVGWECG
jgi:hypothetical protein